MAPKPDRELGEARACIDRGDERAALKRLDRARRGYVKQQDADGLEHLAAACGLDLDPRRWTPGMCAQTLFGQAQVILHQRDERTTRVFVRPSFVGYVEALLDATS